MTPPRFRRPSRNIVRVVALIVIAGAAGALLASRRPADPEALYARALAHVRAFEYEDALGAAQDALDIVTAGGYPPDYVAKFHLLRGQMWLAVYEWDAALADYDAAVALAPTYPEAYYLRGNLFAIRDEIELALADFAQVAALDPNGRYAADARAAITDLERQREALNAP